MIEIQLFPKKDEWDTYLSQKDQSLFSHLYDWGETLASVYHLKIFRLAAREGKKHNKIVGILPLVFFPAPGLESRLISLPYSDAAGIIADNDPTQKQLVLAGLTLAKDLGAVHLELRQSGDLAVPKAKPPVIHTPNRFKIGLNRSLSGYSLPGYSLSDDGETLWKAVGAKIRNQVRKARKSGGRVIVGGSELLGQFYAVFSVNMRDLGSPVHDRMLFDRLAHHLPKRLKILIVKIKDKPVAAAMVFSHNRTLFNPWASSLRRYRPMCPNMLLYWRMLAYGLETGCLRFDFGRSSPHTSTHTFKRQWGAKSQPLTWHVFSRTSHPWEPTCESLVDQKWKSLTLEASQNQGPAIRRWISL
jgi:FemAB-related protein (PEP-CTERM system-associated)